MDDIRKDMELEEALRDCKRFDAYIKITFKRAVKRSRNSQKRREKNMPVQQRETVDSIPAKQHTPKEEKTRVILGRTELYLDDEKLATVLEGLPNRHKLVIEMVYALEYEEKETADMMKLTEHTIHQYKYDALRRMQDELRRDEHGKE